MKILVTGSNGFIGKNICCWLKQQDFTILTYDKETKEPLESLIVQADFVIHLAGINRPLDPQEFYDGNANLTYKLIELVQAKHSPTPLLLSSSIQALKDNDYGKSKKQAEDLVFEYGEQTGAEVFVFRLENAFGKWGKPNYNSVIATFCYNLARNLPIQINDPKAVVPFVYIDDICQAFLNCIGSKGSKDYLFVKPSYEVSIGEVASLIEGFKKSRENLMLPLVGEGFEKKLYSTFLSYLPEDAFSYPLKMNVDERGSFTEFVKSDNRGQVSINIAHSGIVKGNHWHHTKNEKFLVVQGSGIIRFRKIGDTQIFTYPVSGEKLEVVDIPCGYTHNIENTGKQDMITVMWCNEIFDKDHPDTFYEEV